MKFDDINLNEDKTAPKLDLDFGVGSATTNDKKAGSGFSFGGGWGGGWGSTGASWGFGGAEEKKEEKADDTWNFPSTKKDKKKNAGFDFNFDDGLAGDGGADGFDLGSPATTTKEQKFDDDPW